MNSYKNLEIYQLSYKLALEVHKLTMQLPFYELYEEGGQARRSSKSIPSLIAEGYGRKRYKADFLKFLYQALGSCDETTVHLNFIKDTHEDKVQQVLQLIGEYDMLGKKINSFSSYVDGKWQSKQTAAVNKPVTSNQ